MRMPAVATLCVVSVLACNCGKTERSSSHSSPTPNTRAVAPRAFVTGVESLGDFAGMYISPQTATTRHALVSSPGHGGAHCASLIGPGTPDDTDGPNHRGYPTVQLRRVDPLGFAAPRARRRICCGSSAWSLA